YLQIAILLFVGLTSLLALGSRHSFIEAFGQSSTLFGFVALGLYSSLLSYRLVWHPLRRFPGPLGAEVSSLWFSLQVTYFDAHRKALELYETYGSFVRVGSSDLMIVHPSGVPAIHGPQSRCRKASWYDEDWPRQSIHTSRNHQFHADRRRIWSQSFSDKALRGYESRIAVYNKALMQRLGEHGGQPVNAAKWFNYYSYDVMGDLAFDKDFGMLKTGEQHFAVQLLDDAMAVQGLKLPTWMFRMLIAIPGLTKKYWQFIQYCDEQLAAKMAGQKSDQPNIMSVLLAHAGPQPSKPDALTLQSDSRTIIVAGSDTTAATLSHVFYLLAKHPHHIAKLRQELLPLMSGDGTFGHRSIYQATHLNAIINETLRLYPVPPTAVVRKTPPEGIFVDSTYIPGNMNVWTPQYVIGRNEDAYESPHDFVPERWYSKPSMIKTSAGYAPFAIGPYGCIGRPLALMQIRLVVADAVTRFDIAFPTGKDGSEFIENTKDRFTWGLAELSICFSQA
ncbi:unnamed protein product, partial [Aureobasidium uvarum]